MKAASSCNMKNTSGLKPIFVLIFITSRGLGALRVGVRLAPLSALRPRPCYPIGRDRGTLAETARRYPARTRLATGGITPDLSPGLIELCSYWGFSPETATNNSK